MVDILTNREVGLSLLVVICALKISLADGAPGTTLNIQRIFIGRCLEYQEVSRGKIIEPTKTNCTGLWSIFLKAWAYKDPRSVLRSDYNGFFEAAQQTNIPEDKVLLWSGTYGIAHEYSNDGTRYVTLEDSLIGYLVNGLVWCGMVCDTCDGINYEECPDFSTLPKESSQAFWGGASSTSYSRLQFASVASGVVRLMLSGTNQERPAYSRDSFFGQFELPALPKDVQLQAILVNALDKIPLELCSTGSMTKLREDVENKGIQYSCVENPLDVLHLMCVGDSTDKKCLMVNKDTRAVPLRKILSSRAKIGK